jgi:hypothetical protein
MATLDISKEIGRISSRINPFILMLCLALLVCILGWRDAHRKLTTVCGMAEEAQGISTPMPSDPKAMLKSIEAPNESQGYIGRELWRWQQVDGDKIEAICNPPPSDPPEPNQ